MSRTGGKDVGEARERQRRSTRFCEPSGRFCSGRVVSWVRVCRMEVVVCRGVKVWRRGRYAARRDAFALAHACRASRVNVGTLERRKISLDVENNDRRDKRSSWTATRAARAREAGRRGQTKKQQLTFPRSSTPHPRAQTHPKRAKRHAPRASSLNGRAGGLPRRVVAVLLSVVRAGEGICEDRRKGPKSVGDGRIWDEQGSPTSRSLARR